MTRPCPTCYVSYVRILFFAQLKDVTRCAEMELDCDDVDANGLWAELVGRYSGLAQFRASVRLARNSEYVGPDTRFGRADEVALIPPVSGG